jgi:acyl-CoA thioesterase
VTAAAKGPGPDRFAALLGITVDAQGDGRASATIVAGLEHTNPHDTVHGAVFYAVAGAAIAAAANDAVHSGVITSVLIDYLRPAHPGDTLRADAQVAERLEREDLFVARVNRVGPNGDELVARATARGTRRTRV